MKGRWRPEKDRKKTRSGAVRRKDWRRRFAGARRHGGRCWYCDDEGVLRRRSGCRALAVGKGELGLDLTLCKI